MSRKRKPAERKARSRKQQAAGLTNARCCSCTTSAAECRRTHTETGERCCVACQTFGPRECHTVKDKKGAS